MTIISKHTKMQNIIKVWDPTYLLLIWACLRFINSFMYFWTNFGHMTLTFPVGTSRSLDCFIKNCCDVSIFDINMFGPSVHRITTKNHDIIIGLIYSKAMTFDH